MPVDDRRVPPLGSVVARPWWWAGGGGPGTVIVPLVMATFPLIEWRIHVAILHWRPRRLGRLTIDPLLARDHRAHHADPRDVPLVFIPWRALVWMLPSYGPIALLTLPTTGLAP